jgi:dihydrodipicolinate synthase/N-acetylneuraminate lyase
VLTGEAMEKGKGRSYYRIEVLTAGRWERWLTVASVGRAGAVRAAALMAPHRTSRVVRAGGAGH